MRIRLSTLALIVTVTALSQAKPVVAQRSDLTDRLKWDFSDQLQKGTNSIAPSEPLNESKTVQPKVKAPTVAPSTERPAPPKRVFGRTQ